MIKYVHAVREKNVLCIAFKYVCVLPGSNILLGAYDISFHDVFIIVDFFHTG